MHSLCDIHRWIFRHHTCTYCKLPRPVWARGDHTACIVLWLDETQRAEVKRIREKRNRL